MIISIQISQFFIYYSLSRGEAESRQLSRHIRGVIEVGEIKDKNKIVKIKAELECYQNGLNDGKVSPGNSKLMNAIQKKKKHPLVRRHTQPIMKLDSFFNDSTSNELDQPETVLGRAYTAKRKKKISSSCPRSTTTLGLLVEQNSHRDNFRF